MPFDNPCAFHQIKEIGLRKGQMGHALEYFDFPDESKYSVSSMWLGLPYNLCSPWSCMLKF
jgi:hypothetical protein